MLALQQEIEENLDAMVLKLENSHLQRIYDYNRYDAAIVFIRRGVSILYHESDSADALFEFLSDNREPVVKELDDTNFEHLTQASTGATTGDWLCFFYDASCIDCDRLTSTWESVR